MYLQSTKFFLHYTISVNICRYRLANFVELVKKPPNLVIIHIKVWIIRRIRFKAVGKGEKLLERELLALTPADIDSENRTLKVNKSYQRIEGRDVITPPKTPKSKRTISIPPFLVDMLQEYIGSIYGIKKNNRIFPHTKHYLAKEMVRGCKASGVKKIRIHDLRHSHCALLFSLGVTPLEAAERLGHDDPKTTLRIYAHVYPEAGKQVSDRLENLHNS